MTDEQLKLMAEITLQNSKTLGSLVTTVFQVVENMMPLLPSSDQANYLRHQIEQIQSASELLLKAVDQSRKDLGLDVNG